MSKLYWMSKVIATDSADNIKFTPGSLTGLTSTNAQAAINECATNKTGIKMSKSLSIGTTTFSFTNVNFNSNMYVDYFASSEIYIQQPTYNDSTKTITFTCKALTAACTFRIVVTF